MFNLVSLLVAAALVSLQCGSEARAQLETKQMDNELKVKVAPSPKRRRLTNIVSIEQAPPETAVLGGTPLELQCEAMGVPTPTVQWLKNGEPITDYLEETNEITAVYPSSLAWLLSTLVVTSAASGDVFTCVASTSFNTETASTTVYTQQGEDSEEALSLPLFTLSKPIISSYYIQLFQNIGSNAVLRCRVYSPTESQVFWQDIDNNIIYGNSRMKVLPSGDLFITGLRWSDMGEYTCVAKNLYGKTSAVTFLYPMRQKHRKH